MLRFVVALLLALLSVVSVSAVEVERYYPMARRFGPHPPYPHRQHRQHPHPHGLPRPHHHHHPRPPPTVSYLAKKLDKLTSEYKKLKNFVVGMAT